MLLYDCPDILGAITDHRAIINDILQASIGVYPYKSALGQPLELLILLQNAVDQPIEVKMRLQLPKKDKQGNRLSFFAPQDAYEFGMAPLEVGVLHFPIVAHSPTPPNNLYLALISLNAMTESNVRIVRPPTQGRPTTILSTSPFKMNILKEVKFAVKERNPNQFSTSFEILPGQLQSNNEDLTIKFESLWTVQEFNEETEAAENVQNEVKAFTDTLTREEVNIPLTHLTEENFAEMSHPLHPAEVTMIVKLLTYILEGGLDREQNFQQSKSRWFNRLCRLFVNDRDIVNDIPRMIELCYSALIWDAAMLGLTICTENLDMDVGREHERIKYANEIVAALHHQNEMNLNYIYLPLVMAGITLNHVILTEFEVAIDNLLNIEEAIRGREDLAGDNHNEIFDLTQQLITNARRALMS